MKLSLKRIAAVLLTVCLLGAAAGTVYAGGRGPAPQPKPQPQTQPKPQPQPQPKPAQQKTSSPVIGSLSNGSTIGSLSNGSTIGSLSSGSTIGSLSNGSTIGSLLPTNPQSKPTPQPKPRNTEPERGGGRRPQNNPPSAEVRPQNNPPPQSRPAEQPKPAEPGPQVVQEAPRKQAPEQPKQAQAQDPIIITPRSVQAGNASNGGSSRNLPGYSGGDGTGPLIYNP